MAKLKQQSPWIIRYEEIEQLFQADPDISVVYDDSDGYEVRLYVDDPDKALALTELLPEAYEFGNVSLTITVIPSNDIEAPEIPKTQYELIDALFKNNPIVSYCYERNVAGFHTYYVVFKHKIVQYYTDNLADINGYTSTLYQYIARNVFDPVTEAGIFFCTDLPSGDIRTASIGQPLCEWQ